MKDDLRAVGMTNVGNSCFTSAVVQALFAMPLLDLSTGMKKLRNLLFKSSAMVDKKLGGILNHAACMEFYIGNVASILRTDDKLMFKFGTQNDTEEFLISVVASMPGEAKRSMAITRERHGVCNECKDEKVRGSVTEYCTFLEFPERGKDTVTLEDLLVASTKAEEVECRCCATGCNGLSATDTIVVTDINNYVVFCLKRFTNQTGRITTVVDIQLQVTFNKQDLSLLTIIEHNGRTTTCGHYVAHCRNHSTGEFYTYDDITISKTTLAALKSDKVYILVYTTETVSPPNLKTAS
jgi:ubiquitin C-terminal hydrolase